MNSFATALNEFEPRVRTPKKLELTANHRILIIEDDVTLANLLVSILEEEFAGITIDWATSGEEAEYYLEREEKIFGSTPYDLVIADIFLEGEITGLDVWKMCDRKYPDINIIVTSSLPFAKFVSCLKNEYACPSYLPKPFTLQECRDAISEFL